ncbi:acetate kinase [Schlegelella koreensis]|uniref:Acetate kinase n=1 Tax=Piscinibacter koreensis TaxID=2742824 RepID=A0A7Y6NM77_9BURK|nr:acetate kinase [Schlegelella koreensis]
MQKNRRGTARAIGCSTLAVLTAAASAQQNVETPEAAAARLGELRQRIDEQTRQLNALKRALAEQETSINEMRRALGSEALAAQRGGSGNPAPPQVAQGPAAAAAPAQVGQPPDESTRRPEVAPIFEQPGVLTPRGKFVLEPSVQYSYSSSNRVALVGYTVIPAILVGLIDIREVRRNTVTAALTGRFGITNRLEVEAKLPYVYRADANVGREILQGDATAGAFDTNGKGIGDVEVTARYQLNDGGMDRPYYIGSLRYKSRTGKDPFEVRTSRGVQGFRSDGIQTELPTGSGFHGLQGAMTALFPSDPAVFFGTVSYLHTFARNNIVRNTSEGPEVIGKVAPGGIWGFNFGMGLGLNEKSSFSIGYDHASVGRTKINGSTPEESVRIQLGTLLLGYSYRLGEKRTLNVSLGAGLTRDTPDLTLTVRTPVSF